MTIITTAGIVNSSTITPQAGDDLFTSTGITEDSGTTVLNVMANDLGGKAKTLYSLDDGIENEGSSSSADLLTRDFVGASSLSKSGALIKITADGMVSYTMTAASKANFQSLALGEIGTDSFTYAIRLADGTLSTATATVQIMGTNDAPVAMADVNSAFEDTIISGTVAANDTDIDNGAVLTYSLNAPVDGLTINNDGGYSFDAGNAAYQSLGEGVILDVVANYTVTDEFGATSASTLTITLTGTNDVPTIGGVSTGDVTEDATTPDLSASGELTISDVDTGESSFVAQVGTAGSNGYGTFTVNAGGTWTYSALNSQIAIQSLAAGATLTDSFTVTSFDGSNSQVVTVTITGTDEAPVITGPIVAAPWTGINDPNDLDNLTGTNDATQGDDSLVGTSGNDSINGLSGMDNIYGLAGDDTLNGNAGNDLIMGGSGNDVINGNNGTDWMFGGSGNDTITGNNDNDFIFGGYGADTLTGNGGGDEFFFQNKLDTGDTITDFSSGDDTLNFSGITGQFSGVSLSNTVTANSINYFQSGLDTIVWADTDGDTSTVEMQITLVGVDASTLVQADFIL